MAEFAQKKRKKKKKKKNLGFEPSSSFFLSNKQERFIIKKTFKEIVL